ncbi:DNA helicase UvrD [Rhodococcus sp. 05-2256-B2]|uniref:UvrD-helicase domain-containing protein n=1 Tax=unclassified Rhodococcus (in: high G+C Gram-positive bacteria) TaxID=192944 RepID=UPI000B9A4A00|nr:MULTISPECIES: ATP-dependent helicase [unclassified Rhodococcus (in: high G+C Gram-positive bacteria)]OZD77254.1 DNA helicase UvrD [Rhodococcus sp. 05-2256-B4]OZD88373.1 DNA helicase UvrD [Rhodococcus sp. 05-2256-B3]OZD98506.1 DNA helicase UvrD [Rhodococcus sp. 05-2256-B2]OZE05287.1 DNA helicase UvrD [Rhodococcus sp. 05-2256-B1]
MSGFPLSREQLNAATCAKDHLLIIAPPGCGKTEVLAHRAASQIRHLEQNQRVLALTFTKRARSNLEERLRSVLGHARARRQIEVRNLHGFATQVVLAHGRTIGLDMEGLELPKTSTMRRAMEAAGGGGAAMYESERVLSEIKRGPLSDAEVLTALQQRNPAQAIELAEKVERSRQEANQLHYDDLLRHAQRLLRIPAVSRLYQAHFGAVLIDEFQDLSMQQLDLALLSCTSRRTFAGDPLQGIYSWAGATPTEVEAEVRRICGKPIKLCESYRSSPKVLDMVNSVSEQVDPGSSLVSAQPGRWPGRGCSAALVLQNRQAEAELLRRLSGLILNRVPEASIGIIARAGWRRENIDAAFAEEKAFPVRRWDLAIDDPGIVALIQSTVAALPHGASIDDARLAVLNALDPADVDARELVDDAFDTLDQGAVVTAKAAVRSIRASDPRQSVGSGVHLLNAHTGKGQQFDWVFVVGLEEGHLPGKRNGEGDALAEEQRVLLVMLSRARHGLVVTGARMTDGVHGLYQAKPSRWWPGIRAQFSSAEDIETHLDTDFSAYVPNL